MECKPKSLLMRFAIITANLAQLEKLEVDCGVWGPFFYHSL
jgi:hypothetical protein